MTEATEAYDFQGRTMIDRDGDKMERVRLSTEEYTGEETISEEDVRTGRIATDVDARS